MTGQRLCAVDKFTYLGNALYRAVHIDDEVTARTVKASVAFDRLGRKSWTGMESDLTLQGIGTEVLQKAWMHLHVAYILSNWPCYKKAG